jgi:hypothetical protein
MMSRLIRAAAALASVALIAPLAACSGGPGDGGDLDGCLVGDRGTIAVGVTNTAGEPLAVSDIDLTEGSGIAVVDRFIALDDEARDTAVVFSTASREQFGGVDLDRGAIEPDGAAYLGIEVRRTGAADGIVSGLVVTSGGTPRSVPVTLVLTDVCD